MRSLPQVELPRSVDDGLVFCPVQMGYVEVDRCTRCGFMTRAEHDATGALAGFVCEPTHAALLSGMSI